MRPDHTLQHRRKLRCRQVLPRAATRRGYTLVEMLISIALVVLIMSLFATVFQITSKTITTQRGIARNDNKARLMSLVVTADIENRSFRFVYPFQPGQTTDPPPNGYDPIKRRGLFSIAENDPNSTTDDVLHLTVIIPVDGSQRLYSGRATVLFDPTAIDPLSTDVPPGVYPQDEEGYARYLRDHPNQPEMDDGQVAKDLVPFDMKVDNNANGFQTGGLNGGGASRVAEVAYFLRNGNLIRRVLLVRDPYASPGAPAQPGEITDDYRPGGTNNAGQQIAPYASGSFWHNFDYSGFYNHIGGGRGMKFHSAAVSLANDNPPANGVDPAGFPISLGIPHLRYGYSIQRGELPREFDQNGNFIGRFTVEETSHSKFGYPGHLVVMSVPGDGNSVERDPHTRDDSDLTLNGSGVIKAYAGENRRRAEDILLTNVHEFDIQVWDDGLAEPAWVNLGNGGGGYYGTNARNPADNNWNRYDTWHPYPLGTPPRVTPFRPVRGAPDVLGSDSEIPLRSIRIRVRFYDAGTDRMRQVTIEQSLLDL